MRGPRSRLAATSRTALTRNAHPHLDLGADRYPLDQRSQLVGEERVALVLPVEANLGPEQASRDADADAGQGSIARGFHEPPVVHGG